MKTALIILPGITANPLKRRFVYDYLCRHTACEVHLPRLPQRLGIRASARRLSRFLRPFKLYDQVHVLAYISGGFILRAASLPVDFPWGRLLYVRSPLQEEVPRRFIARHGRLAAFLAHGRMLFDLSSDWKDHLPYPVTTSQQGLVLEHGVSQLAQKLGLNTADFARFRTAAGFQLPAAGKIWEAGESHDDVYTAQPLLERMTRFFMNGTFLAPNPNGDLHHA